MPTALALPTLREPSWLTGLSPQARAFLAWVACWLVLTNLPFLPITIMGGPPRYPDIIACGLVGMIARRMAFPARVALFVALMTYLVLAFIARMFNMAFSMILSVAGLVFDIQPAASPEYVAGAGALLLVIAGSIWLLRRPMTFGEPKYLLGAVAATLAFAGADHIWSRDTMGAYSRLPSADAPFASALGQSGLAGLADGRTNIMLVMVEAMGEPVDPALRAKLDAVWMRPELARNFEITRGQTLYYGSTTSGEIRELCGRWGNYPELSGPQPACLPAVLARKGYEASSWHAFVATFFERERWYPHLGFSRSVWGQDMLDAGASLCPNVFPGACDRDVPRLIHRQLQSATRPQFIYWLTLNSHLPVVENRELGTVDCKGAGARIDRDLPMVCRLFAVWNGTADALTREVSRPDFPPTHILIVGDHMPPFTHQQSRLQFDTAKVPWILLRWRGSDPAQASPRSAR